MHDSNHRHPLIRSERPTPLNTGELLALQRLTTPTVYNGWEQITAHNTATDGFNLQATHDFMPGVGPIAGYAVTVVIQPSDPEPPQRNRRAYLDYLGYVASVPGPKIVVVQDLDAPRPVGSFWGEVNSSCHRALGGVGTITDGAIRDVEEMAGIGFKALARQLCVGHACSCPIRWGCEVEVFGRRIQPGQLIHADRHGFLAIPPEDEGRLLAAATALDTLEGQHLTAAARDAVGQTPQQALAAIEAGLDGFLAAARERFGGRGEW